MTDNNNDMRMMVTATKRPLDNSDTRQEQQPSPKHLLIPGPPEVGTVSSLHRKVHQCMQ